MEDDREPTAVDDGGGGGDAGIDGDNGINGDSCDGNLDGNLDCDGEEVSSAAKPGPNAAVDSNDPRRPDREQPDQDRPDREQQQLDQEHDDRQRQTEHRPQELRASVAALLEQRHVRKQLQEREGQGQQHEEEEEEEEEQQEPTKQRQQQQPEQQRQEEKDHAENQKQPKQQQERPDRQQQELVEVEEQQQPAEEQPEQQQEEKQKTRPQDRPNVDAAGGAKPMPKPRKIAAIDFDPQPEPEALAQTQTQQQQETEKEQQMEHLLHLLLQDQEEEQEFNDPAPKGRGQEPSDEMASDSRDVAAARLDSAPVEPEEVAAAATIADAATSGEPRRRASDGSSQQSGMLLDWNDRRPRESSWDRLKNRLEPRWKHLRKKMRMRYKQEIQPFRKIAIAQVLCVIYILVLTFSPVPVGLKDPSTGDIIDPASEANTANGVLYVNGSYRPVIAIGGWQKFCLAMSRMSAFSMYPVMVSVFVTKMKALQSFWSKTPLSMYLGVVNQAHDHHVHAGAYIAFDVWIHTLFHILRWASQGNIELLWTSAAGITGLVAVVATPLVAYPMMYFKTRIRYEVRKAMHYLFYAFAISLCFHVPVTAVPNGGFLAPVLGLCIVIYTLDAAYVFFFMCERIETTSFHVLSTGVQISMPVSDRFRKRKGGARGGYAYICIPWINDKQWHAFSLFEDPKDASTQQMFLMKCGDWTNAVHTALSRDTTRPCWIKGPFPSPYSHASSYDNQILVASGIGITPALAAINAFKKIRRVNLIWACRDPEMLEFYLEHMYLDHDGWNLIFYTGKQPLNEAVESVNTNVRVIKGRPQLASVIPNIIYGIESKSGLPEEYTETSKAEVKRGMTELMSDLDNSGVRATEKVSQLRSYGEKHGFSLHELVNEANFASASTRSLMSIDVESPAAEDEAKCLLKDLKSSMTMTMGMYVNKPSSQSADASVAFEEEEDPAPPKRPAFARRRSMERWATVRHLVNKRDSNALLAPPFHPWKNDESQEKCVKRLSEHIMQTWGIMYCGGSQPVIAALREISIDYDVDLHIDSFAW